jgi:hypothetical protein
VPTNVSAKAGHCSVTLTWTAPVSDGGVAITGYAITWGNGPGLDVGDVTSATVTGLRSGIAYSFTISAINAAGSGPGSAASNSVTPLKATTTTVLKLSKLKATYGQEQAEHASVTVSSSLPGTIATGTVTIKELATAVCVIKLRLGKGSCTFSPERLKAGIYRLVAVYGGSTTFMGSTSAKEILTVAK